MLSAKDIPKVFWPEAVKWATHVMNRSPTLSVKNITPEEAWSGIKPSVKYFRVFGCLAHVHVPDNQRVKLDNKSIKCIHLGVSDESKAYKLYDPAKKKIVVSRDVVFEECKAWNWNSGVDSSNNQTACDTDDDNDLAETLEVNNDDDNSDSSNNESGVEIVPDTSSSEEDNLLPPRIRKTPQKFRDCLTGSQMDQAINAEEALHNLAIFVSSEDPKTFDEAQKLDVWKKAMDQEIGAIEKNNTWELTDLPAGVNTIGVKWIYKTKYNERGEIEKHKARLVAKGYSQQHGIDFDEVFAPVARWDNIRTILALAAKEGWKIFQLDVKSAFLHGELNEDIYVQQPLGYQKGNGDKVYKLKKALYGLRQAPRAWYSRIETYFNDEQFIKCSHEHTLFVKYGAQKKILIVSLYVDDLICTGNDLKMIHEFKESMQKNFAMTDLGKMKYFLGVEVTQSDNGIFIHQAKYAAEILKRFGMENCNKVCSPIVPGCKLVRDENGKTVNATKYKQMVGCLMYLLASRPDLAYFVCLVSRYMDKPTEMHFCAVKRILRYLKGTMSYGIMYKKNAKGQLNLVGWSDSDYAGDMNDRKSTSGYVFMLGDGAISWSSKKQPIVTLSTTEAEYVAASACACQCVWLKNILSHLKVDQDSCTVIFCDNSSSIKLSKNPVMHGRCKHIDVRFHFLRNLAKDGVVELRHCKSQDQLADLMTKPLKLDTFVKLRENLGMAA
jgi:hypothetical protein